LTEDRGVADMGGGRRTEHLKCYTQFVEQRILPLYRRYDPKKNAADKVRYEDLFCLFRPGDLAYAPEPRSQDKNAPRKVANNLRDDSERDISQALPPELRNPPRTTIQRFEEMEINQAKSTLNSSAYQHLLRIVHVWPSPCSCDIDPISIEHGRVNVPKNPDAEANTYIYGYYVGFDGESCGPVGLKFHIPYFAGKKDIKNLPVFPLEYAESKERILERLLRRGQNFVNYVKTKHLAYRGWTLSLDEEGEGIEDEQGKPLRRPEHVDSDVIVDFSEAFVASPAWKPDTDKYAPYILESPIGADEFPLKMWSDSSRKEFRWSEDEWIWSNDYIESTQSRDNMDKDRIMTDHIDIDNLSDSLKILLPRRIFAYSLRERKFIHGDVQCFGVIRRNAKAFDDLKIDDHLKKTVLGLVYTHFEKKKIDRWAIHTMQKSQANFDSKLPENGSLGYEPIDQDFIRGKGRGLFILLHGAPEVGKTATAEAAAQISSRPLFSITCGDIGFTPDTVEKSLNDIFTLAHQWDCVLLLDEADVFLSQRQPNDLKRNALVSGK
jgi:hypothetical protein